jgi:hypothetical protein
VGYCGRRIDGIGLGSPRLTLTGGRHQRATIVPDSAARRMASARGRHRLECAPARLDPAPS